MGFQHLIFLKPILLIFSYKERGVNKYRNVKNVKINIIFFYNLQIMLPLEKRGNKLLNNSKIKL